jgi:hypothetical protein
MAGWVGGGRLVVLLLLVTQLLGQLAAETPGSPTSLRLYNPIAANPIIPATEYIFYCKRAILSLSSSKILTPHPLLRPASVYPPPLLGGRDRIALLQ